MNLCHPNIVRLYDHFEDQNNVYLLLELANRGNLFSEIHRQRLSEDVIRRYFKQTCKGIKYLHENDIIHRDIKPENLLIDRENNIKICDFGWCVRSAETRTTLCGTLEYMAPEMILGGGHSFAIDIWALGVLLFEMAHGRAPFTGCSEYEKCQQILTLSCQTDPALSPALSDLIHFMLNPAPEERPNIAAVLSHPWVADAFNTSSVRRTDSALLQEIAADQEDLHLASTKKDELLWNIEECCRTPRFATPSSELMNQLERSSKTLEQSLITLTRDSRERNEMLPEGKVIKQEEEIEDVDVLPSQRTAVSSNSPSAVFSSAEILHANTPSGPVPSLTQIPRKLLTRHNSVFDDEMDETGLCIASEPAEVCACFEQERESIDYQAKNFYNEAEGKWISHSRVPSIIEAPEARKSTYLPATKGLKILEDIEKLQSETRRPVPEQPPLEADCEGYTHMNQELALRKQRISELMNASDFHTSTVAKRARPKRQEDSAFFRWLSSVFGCTDR